MNNLPMGIVVRDASSLGRVTAVWLMTDDWKGAHRVMLEMELLRTHLAILSVIG